MKASGSEGLSLPILEPIRIAIGAVKNEKLPIPNELNATDAPPEFALAPEFNGPRSTIELNPDVASMPVVFSAVT